MHIQRQRSVTFAPEETQMNRGWRPDSLWLVPSEWLCMDESNQSINQSINQPTRPCATTYYFSNNQLVSIHREATDHWDNRCCWVLQQFSRRFGGCIGDHLSSNDNRNPKRSVVVKSCPGERKDMGFVFLQKCVVLRVFSHPFQKNDKRRWYPQQQGGLHL